MTLGKRWEIEGIEDVIIDYLNKNKKVYIEDGCLNDKILSYSVNNESKEREVIFTTSACVFPEQINLMGTYSSIDTEEFEGSLFVHVS